MAGLEYFTITTHDRSYLKTVRSIIDSVTYKQQKKESGGGEEVNNKNQILIEDPDGIQILIKSE